MNRIAAAITAAMLTSPSGADDLSWAKKIALDCKTSFNATVCRNGKPREVCSQRSLLSWADTRVPITRGEQVFVSLYSPVLAVPPCSCLDVRKSCLSKQGDDCVAMFKECNISVGSGGQFCLPNQWGGTTCYGP
jgi:hypothetical protein